MPSASESHTEIFSFLATASSPVTGLKPGHLCFFVSMIGLRISRPRCLTFDVSNSLLSFLRASSYVIFAESGLILTRVIVQLRSTANIIFYPDKTGDFEKQSNTSSGSQGQRL